MTLYEKLLKEAHYALDSNSKNLIYETYGKVKMAFELDALTREQFFELNDMLIRNGLNKRPLQLI